MKDMGAEHRSACVCVRVWVSDGGEEAVPSLVTIICDWISDFHLQSRCLPWTQPPLLIPALLPLFLSFWPGHWPLCLPKQGCSDAFSSNLALIPTVPGCPPCCDHSRLTGSPGSQSLNGQQVFPGAAQSSVHSCEFLPCFLYFWAMKLSIEQINNSSDYPHLV